jgi:hypothetical protein
MAKRNLSAFHFDAVLVMQIAVAAFLITLGLAELMHWDSGLAQLGRGINRAFGRANNPVSLIMAILELVAGGLVLISAFAFVQTRLLYYSTLAIAILWALRILFGFFSQGVFEPDFVIWLNRLAADVIILLALWMVSRQHA